MIISSSLIFIRNQMYLGLLFGKPASDFKYKLKSETTFHLAMARKM
jgi:hypothetical protein